MLRIISQQSLYGLSLDQLRRLRCQVKREFALSAAGSKEREQALANLSALERAITLKAYQRPAP